jgi:hypothetical protein
VSSSAYKTGLTPAATHLGRHLQALAAQSVGLATEIGKHVPGSIGQQLITGAHHAFVHAADQGVLIAAAVTLAGAIVALRCLPAPARVPNPLDSRSTPPSSPPRRPPDPPHHTPPHRSKTMTQTTINPDAPLVTLINVFTVAPEDQKPLISLWQQATDDIIRHLPGFISANPTDSHLRRRPRNPSR